MVGCLADQVGLSPHGLGGELVVEVVDRDPDRGRLLGQYLTADHRLAGLVVGGQGLGELGVASGFTRGHHGDSRAATASDPSRRSPRGGRGSGLGAGRGDSTSANLERSVVSRVTTSVVSCAFSDHAGVSLMSSRPVLEQVEETQDRVSGPGVVEVPAHGSTQAPTTDTPGRSFPLNHGVVENFSVLVDLWIVGGCVGCSTHWVSSTLAGARCSTSGASAVGAGGRLAHRVSSTLAGARCSTSGCSTSGLAGARCSTTGGAAVTSAR